MKVYFEALTMAHDMKDHFEVVDGNISETYTGKHTAPYKGHYKQTDMSVIVLGFLTGSSVVIHLFTGLFIIFLFFI